MTSISDPSPRSPWLSAAARLAGVIGLRARVLIFSGLLGAIGLLLFLLVVPTLEPVTVPFSVPWPIFAIAYFVAEVKVIDVRFRGGTHTFSLTEVPAVIGLFFVDPVWYVVAIVSGACAALLLARQPLPKFGFNLGQYFLGAVASVITFYVIGGAWYPIGPLEPIDWFAAFAAMLVVSTISAFAIATVITLAGREQQFGRLPEALQVGALFAITNTALALLVVEILWVQPEAAWLVAVPLATLFVAYRAYLLERQKHESLELLYQSSQIFQRSPQFDTAILAMLEHACLMFRTERAEMLLLGEEDGVPLRTAVGPDGSRITMARAPERAPIMHRLLESSAPFIDDDTDQSASADRLFGFAMVSPLRGESGIIGALLVADRLDENDEFTRDQLRMLETIANQVAVALENGQLEQSLTELSRLKEELRHQAFHDPLTGLANRALFVDVLAERMAAFDAGSAAVARGDPSASHPPVVLFLDLDDFKIVNDTVGHGAGDRLLRGTAERLKAATRDDDLAARLGGDEFAVLLAGGPDAERAELIADRIAASLARPFQLVDREFHVGASIGLAIARPGQDGQDLLKNADVAMYAAKAQGKRQLAVWSPEMNAVVLERHSLTAELARAVENGDVHVAYQPLVSLEDHRVIGFEALARWKHAQRGPIGPDVFIRLAEDGGLIRALGRSVLVDACEQTARWSRDSGLEDIVISVNLSPYQVQEADFAQDVLSILAASGLAPEHLLLEMTETAMFSDIDATIGKLQALRERGVRIAVDDFGTGYSSLRWLRQFPVDVLKLAREFVVEDDASNDEWAFAHAIVMLGRTLGLNIIAEGIETAEQASRLRTLGCDLGQGYLFGHAVPAEQVKVSALRQGVNRALNASPGVPALGTA